jgi:hypothetical protein
LLFFALFLPTQSSPYSINLGRMSTNSLAPEILGEIFEAPFLEQEDLASLCRVDKRFNAIAKPLLHRSVILYSHPQVEKLIGKEDKEDAELIGSIAVVGKENPWEIEEMQDLHDQFAAMSEMDKMQTEAGGVKKLLESDFARSSREFALAFRVGCFSLKLIHCIVHALTAIKSLFVHQVVEDPTVLWNRSFEVVPQIVESLKDLSIVSHRGGVNVFQYLLNRRSLPNLKRLTLCDIMYTDPGGVVPIGDGPFMELSRDGLPLCKKLDPLDYENLEAVLEDDGCDLFEGTKLKLLVSPSYGFLDNYPTLLRLAVVSHTHEVRLSDKYAVVYISTRSTSATEIDTVFRHLNDVANNYSVYSLKYLAIPSLLDSRLSQVQKVTLTLLTNLGVAIHRDGDLGRSIAPESFFEFRKKEEDEGPSRASSSN